MKQIKSKKRVSVYGEVFINEREVNAMLNLLPGLIMSIQMMSMRIWHLILVQHQNHQPGLCPGASGFGVYL